MKYIFHTNAKFVVAGAKDEEDALKKYNQFVSKCYFSDPVSIEDTNVNSVERDGSDEFEP